MGDSIQILSFPIPIPLSDPACRLAYLHTYERLADKLLRDLALSMQIEALEETDAS